MTFFYKHNLYSIIVQDNIVSTVFTVPYKPKQNMCMSERRTQQTDVKFESLSRCSILGRNHSLTLIYGQIPPKSHLKLNIYKNGKQVLNQVQVESGLCASSPGAGDICQHCISISIHQSSVQETDSSRSFQKNQVKRHTQTGRRHSNVKPCAYHCSYREHRGKICKKITAR